jgi:hypothetical protein
LPVVFFQSGQTRVGNDADGISNALVQSAAAFTGKNQMH